MIVGSLRGIVMINPFYEPCGCGCCVACSVRIDESNPRARRTRASLPQCLLGRLHRDGPVVAASRELPHQTPERGVIVESAQGTRLGAGEFEGALIVVIRQFVECSVDHVSRNASLSQRTSEGDSPLPLPFDTGRHQSAGECSIVEVGTTTEVFDHFIYHAVPEPVPSQSLTCFGDGERSRPQFSYERLLGRTPSFVRHTRILSIALRCGRCPERMKPGGGSRCRRTGSG